MKATMISLLAILLICGALTAGTVENMTVVVNTKHVMTASVDGGGEAGALGAGGYCPADGCFYTAVFGSGANIRKFDPSAEELQSPFPVGVWSDSTGTSYAQAYPSDILKIANCTNIPNGTWGQYGAVFRASSMVFNPAPLTWNGIFYDTGELGIMSSTDYDVLIFYDDVKILMSYDRREIGASTVLDPDYDTARDGSGFVTGAYGVTDWNDVFTNVLSHQEIADAIGVSPSMNQYYNFGRQVVWSSDASKIYACAASHDFGGVWMVDMTMPQGASGRAVRLLSEVGVEDEDVRLYSEPGILPTSVRDLTGGAQSGDQVLFRGSGMAGNIGGMNCIVGEDTAAPNEVVYEVLNGPDFINFIEYPDPCWLVPSTLPDVTSVTCDPAGNIYFGYSGTNHQAIYVYDTQDRLMCLRSKALNYEFQKENGKNDTAGPTNRLQWRETADPRDPNNATIGQICYQGVSLKSIVGIYLFKPLDFDLDDAIDVDDTELFKTQLERTWNNDVPAIDDEFYLDYLKADLNGNAYINENQDGLMYPAVTDRDIEIFYQFLLPGDANFDKKVDLADFADFVAGYNAAGTDKTWADGDFDFDSDVDMVDWAMMMSYWLDELP